MVGPAVGVVALTATLKLEVRVVDAPFAEFVGPLLAVDMVLPVTTAECVWITVVPFSVHKLLNVV